MTGRPGTLMIRRARLPGGGLSPEMDDLADIRIEDGVIREITAHDPEATCAGEVLDAEGCAVIPGFVDCHTHACFAGDRLDEWERKLAGASYLELMKAGGGIMATVRATRAASEAELASSLRHRLDVMLRHGTTTAEVKSGYGLDTDNELKMLRAIARAAEDWPGTVVPTACIGHAIDPAVDRETFIRRTITETLPAVTAEFPGIALDAYCEDGAWSLQDCLALFDAGMAAGHPVRVHADQFNALGMIEAACERRFTSVDHLEATDTEGLRRLAAAGVYGVMLPASGFHTDGRYGNGRAFLDAGGKLAIATNYNPGTAPCPAMPFVLALAVRKLGLSPAEVLDAATRSGAALLDLEDRGTIHPGKRADLLMTSHTDSRNLSFEFGHSGITQMIVDGTRN